MSLVPQMTPLMWSYFIDLLRLCSGDWISDKFKLIMSSSILRLTKLNDASSKAHVTSPTDLVHVPVWFSLRATYDNINLLSPSDTLKKKIKVNSQHYCCQYCVFTRRHVRKLHSNKIAIFLLLYCIPSSYMVYYRYKQAHGSSLLPALIKAAFISVWIRAPCLQTPRSSIWPPFTGAIPLNSCSKKGAPSPPDLHLTQEQTSNRQEDVQLYERSSDRQIEPSEWRASARLCEFC